MATQTKLLQVQPFLRSKLEKDEAKYNNDNGISNKAQDFIKILETDNVVERKRIEKEIWNETKRLQN